MHLENSGGDSAFLFGISSVREAEPLGYIRADLMQLWALVKQALKGLFLHI